MIRSLCLTLAVLCASCQSTSPSIPILQTKGFSEYMASTQQKPKFAVNDKIYLIDSVGKVYIGTITKVGPLGIWESADKKQKRVARAYTVLLTHKDKTGSVIVPGFLLKKRK